METTEQPKVKPLEHQKLADVQKAADAHYSFPVKFKRQNGRWFMTRKDEVDPRKTVTLGAGCSPGHAFVDSMARIKARKIVAERKGK